MRLAENFHAALQYSQEMRDRFLGPYFYQKYALEGRYVFVEKSACSTLLQKQLAVDTLVQSPRGGSLCIEEKIEQWPGYWRKNFALETASCTLPGKERPGWMQYAQADYLLYAFAYPGNQGLRVYFIDFPQLREWFWHLPVRYPAHVMETQNRTRFEKVPIVDVRKAVSVQRYHLSEQGCQYIPERSAA